jgi:hypothetical protein
MRKISILFVLFFSFCCQANAQLFPRDGNKLCYRLIGFSFPACPGAIKYKIEVAKGTYDSEGEFTKHVVTSVVTTTNKIIKEVPSFGCDYTWRIISILPNNRANQTAFHHFSVKMTPDVDPEVTRLKITKDAETYKDAYIFVDGNRAMYDMKGNPVWFLPGSEKEDNKAVATRDLKITPYGTITFFTGGHPYEINYNGKILWQYTNPNVAMIMHHEFTRVNNNHFMTLVYEDSSGHSMPMLPDSIAHYMYDSSGFFRSTRYSNLIEFDENGRPVWQWNGLQYERNSDIRLRKTVDCSKLDYDLHENAFFFDEKNKVIYLSIRNISRILKIKYPEGTLLNTYGITYKAGLNLLDGDLFCGQHSVKHSPDGYMYLYNNNSCNKSMPTIVKLQDTPPGKNERNKIWEFPIPIEKEGMDVIGTSRFISGGSVTELPDKSMLVIMGLPYTKTFIVNKNKKVVWSALPEKYDPATKKWGYSDQYRVCLVSRKEVEQLIWDAEK